MAIIRREVLKTFTFEQQRLEINDIAQDLYNISTGEQGFEALQIDGALVDSAEQSGTPGQVLISTETGVLWKTLSISNVLWVTKDGDDNNDGLSQETAKASIKSALLAANSGYLGKLQDASNQILVNRKLIQEEAIGWLKTEYGSFNFSTSEMEDLCYRDVGHIIDAIASDLKNGGNVNSIESGNSYFKGNLLSFINNELQESIATFNKAKDLMILAIRNWQTDSLGTVYSPVYSLIEPYIDNSLVVDVDSEDNPVFPPCADVELSIENYFNIIQFILENGENTVEIQQPTFKTTIFVKSGVYTEQNPVVLPPNTGIVGDNLREVTILPANPTEDVFYLNNGSYITGVTFSNHLYPSAVGSFPKVKVGNTVQTTADGIFESYILNVSSSENLSIGMTVFGDGIGTGSIITKIDGTTVTLSVANRETFTGRTINFDNYVGTAGVIAKSPYIQNCTSLTTTGSGLRVDGNLAKGTASFVLDSYTQYNQGGDGIVILNQGYAQLVSIFEICCDRAVYLSGGSTCSITNSNTDFGNYGLVADGISPLQYTANIDQTQPSNFEFNIKNIRTKPYVGQVVTFGNNGNPYYFITNIVVTNQGDGYNPLDPPQIIIDSPTGPDGITAQAVPTIENGKITEIIVLSSGSQYIQSPTISIVGGNPTIQAQASAKMYPQYYTITDSTEVNNNTAKISLDEIIPFDLSDNTTVYFYQVSKIIANSHCFEYVGSGTRINRSIPAKGGEPIQENETVELNGGRVSFTSTDHLGNFRIGSELLINQNTGTLSGAAFERSLFTTITPFIITLGA
jgi:hypothetical protein